MGECSYHLYCIVNLDLNLAIDVDLQYLFSFGSVCLTFLIKHFIICYVLVCKLMCTLHCVNSFLNDKLPYTYREQDFQETCFFPIMQYLL